MKELTIEQKAQRYDKAIIEFKAIYDLAKEQGRTIDVQEFERIFPELKESEDERIRKWLIEMVGELRKANQTNADHNGNCSDAIAWLEKQNSNVDNANKEYWRGYREGKQEILDKYADLEKQGEQNPIDKIQLGKKYKCIASPRYSAFITGEIYKPEDKFLCSLMNFCSDCFEPIEDGEQKHTDKVEQRFKVGDIITNGKIIGKVDENDNNKYHGWFGYDKNLSVHYSDIPDIENWHKWTIKDVKAGDVLSSNDGHGNDCIELIKSITDKKIEFWFCLTNGNRYEVFDGITPYTNLVSREDATPATKEQRDALMKAMADAGYAFDFEKKELRKLKFRVGDIVKSKSQPMLDARKIISIGKDCYWCEDRGCIGFAWEDDCELVEPQPKQEWSEEDEENLNWFEKFFRPESLITKCKDIPQDRYLWFKSLKDRVQPKQEWSEKDKIIISAISGIINIVERITGDWYYTGSEKVFYSDIRNWLNSLKERVQPQNK